MIQNIDFLTFEIDFLIYYTEQLSKAFTRRGISCRIFNLNEGRTREHLQALFSSPPDLLMGVSCLGAEPIFLSHGYPRGLENLEERMPLICDTLRIPYVSFHIDPPLQYQHHLQSHYSFMAHIDQRACDLLRDVSLKRVFFMPYGADPYLNGEKERSLDAIFLANCYDYEAIAKTWEGQFSSSIRQMMHDVAETTLSRPDAKLMDVFLEVSVAYGIDLTAEKFTSIYYHVENYLRGKERVALIRSLKGIDIHVFGGQVKIDTISNTKKWGQYFADCPNVHIHPSISYEESLRMMKRSKFVLNSCPQFRGGMHDRVVNGMACGAVVATNDNGYVRSLFNEDEHCLFFQYGDFEPLQEKLQKLLTSKEAYEKMSSTGQNEVLLNHSWDERIEQFLAQWPELQQLIY